MVDFDAGLVLAIWTGSVPLLVAIVGYGVSKRTEARKIVRQRKEQVYRRFLWAIGEAVQALDDLRTLQLSKIKSGRDEEEVAANYVRLIGLSSLWTDPDAMETLRSIAMGDDEDNEPPRPKQIIENFEDMKQLFTMELYHVFLVSVKRLGRYGEEIRMFTLSPSLRASLDKVWQLLGQKHSAVVAGSLLELAGLRGMDTGKDVDQSISTWNAALEELRKELNDDLKATL